MKSTIAGNEYVRPRDGNVYIGDTRVTLASIVILWRNGETPGAIHDEFPTVRLAAIYGTIAYYLDHQAEVDIYLEELDTLWRAGRDEAEAADPAFYARMRARLAQRQAGREVGAASEPTNGTPEESVLGSPTA